MKNKENEKYFKLAFTWTSILIICVCCFFLIYRIDAFALFFQRIIRILTPFVYGAVIAYVLAPACNWLEIHFERVFLKMKLKNSAKRFASGFAIIICITFTVWIAASLLMLVIPQVCGSIIGIINALPAQLKSASEWLHDLLESYPELQEYWDNFSTQTSDKINAWITTDLLPIAQFFLDGLGSQVVNVFSILKNVFLGLIVSIYFLASRKKFAAQAKLALYGIFKEKWANLIYHEVLYVDCMFSGFLIGMLLDSAMVGVICFIGTTLMHFESALLISVVVGTTNIIPFFGPFIGAVPCAFLLLLENPVHCIYFIIFILILQQIDGNIISPKILGNSTGISSFWVLFSIILFGGLWGFVGMIIGVPLFAVIYDILRRLILRGLRRHNSEGLLEEYSQKFDKKEAVREETGNQKETETKKNENNDNTV